MLNDFVALKTKESFFKLVTVKIAEAPSKLNSDKINKHSCISVKRDKINIDNSYQNT